MKKKIVPFTIAALMLTGCSGAETGSEDAPPPAAEETTPEPTVAEPSPSLETTEAEPAALGFETPAPFGETVTFPDGVEVTISPVSFQSQDEVEVNFEGEGMLATFEITITNGSSARIDAGGMSWPTVTFGPDGQQADLNSNADITTLLQGDNATDQFTRFIPEEFADQVRVEIDSPDMMSPSAIFEGSMDS